MKIFIKYLGLFLVLLSGCTRSASSSDNEKFYRIVWMQGTIVLEIDENVAHGSLPHYGGPTPVQPPTEEYTYPFNGWSPTESISDSNYVSSLPPVTKSVTYYATFTIVLIDQS